MKNRNYRKGSAYRQAGFTLVETMIYIALFGIVIYGAFVGAYNILEGGKRNINTVKIEEEGTFLSRKINWELSGASSVTVSGGGSTLTINKPSSSPTEITVSGNEMTIKRGSGVAIGISNDRFTVSDINFVYTPATNGRPPSISATFKVEQKTFSFRNYIRQ